MAVRGEIDRGSSTLADRFRVWLRRRRRSEAPVDWQMDFQRPATLVMEYIHWFSWYTV